MLHPHLKKYRIYRTRRLAHQAQNLEGQILKRVLLQGIEKGVVCLPVHDAVAVQQQHADWATEAMSDAWEEEVGMGVKPRLKVDYP